MIILDLIRDLGLRDTKCAYSGTRNHDNGLLSETSVWGKDMSSHLCCFVLHCSGMSPDPTYQKLSEYSPTALLRQDSLVLAKDLVTEAIAGYANGCSADSLL